MKAVKLSKVMIVSILLLTLCGCAGKKNENLSHNFSINQTAVELELGETFQLIATYGKEQITYETSDKKIIAVDKGGIITAVGEGKANITMIAKDSKVEKNCEVNVINPEYKIEFTNHDNYPVMKNARIKLSVLTTRDEVEYSDDVTWKVDSKDAVIESHGKNAEFIATKTGEYHVTVTSGKGAKAELNIVVTDESVFS